MPPRRRIVGFLWRFVLAYGLLIFPWPGFNKTYSGYFRALGQMTFSRETGPRYVQFEAVPAELHHRLDTRIALANRAQADHAGNVLVRYLELDTRGVGWVPTALLLALILASPVPWRRRGVALVWGLLAVHGYILFSVACDIWNNSVDLLLLTLSAFWKSVVEGLDETLVTQMGVSFVVPVFIWMLVTLRRQDLIDWQLILRKTPAKHPLDNGSMDSARQARPHSASAR